MATNTGRREELRNASEILSSAEIEPSTQHAGCDYFFDTAKLIAFIRFFPDFGLTVNTARQVPTFRPLIAAPTSLQTFGVDTFADSEAPFGTVILKPAANSLSDTLVPTLSVHLFPACAFFPTENFGAENEISETVKN